MEISNFITASLLIIVFIALWTVYKKQSIIKPMIYVLFEVGFIIGIWILSYTWYHAIAGYAGVLLLLYLEIWTLGILFLYWFKSTEHKHLHGVPILEILEVADIRFPYNLLIFVFSSPALSIFFMLFLNLSENNEQYLFDLVAATILFSSGLMLPLVNNVIKASKDYPRTYIRTILHTIASELPKLDDHIVIGGYGNLGKSISERLLQFLYLSGVSTKTHIKKEVRWFWLFDGNKLKLEKLFPFLLVVDKDYDKWDYRIEDAHLGAIGIEQVIPMWGDHLYVPIIGPDLKSDNVWNLLNFEKARAIVQTFHDEQIENYLLQKPSSSTVIVRSSNSTSYSEISEKDKQGKALRFYPPFELSTLLMRRIYAAVSNLMLSQNDYVIFLVGSGPELYYALKAWDKLISKESLIHFEDCSVFLKNVIVITDDVFILKNSAYINDLETLDENLRELVTRIVCLNDISGSFIRSRLYEYYLPIRHKRDCNSSDNFKKVLVINVVPEIISRIFNHILSNLHNYNPSMSQKPLVPIFVIVGKEGLSESLCLEVFKALSEYSGEYWIIAPYFFRNEFERLLESAIVSGLDLTRIHLFHPYKTIREGVSNIVGWDY